MGNEYNMAMLDKQIQEQWKMWQAENEYNSASAQRQRLEAAGLNPYLMMDGGDAGSASSMTAPAAQGAIVPTMQVPPQSGLQEFLAAIDGITQLAGGITNTLFTGTQIAGANVDNVVKKQTALADIQQRRALSQISQITAGNEKTRQNLNIAGQSISNEAAYQSLLGHAVDNLRAYTELQALPQQLQYSLAIHNMVFIAVCLDAVEYILIRFDPKHMDFLYRAGGMFHHLIPPFQDTGASFPGPRAQSVPRPYQSLLKQIVFP